MKTNLLTIHGKIVEYKKITFVIEALQTEWFFAM